MAPWPPVRSWSSWTTFFAFSAQRWPGTTTSNSRCSGSTAVWSQSSPLSSSRGSSGSQFFCFLPTKFHFSSNWTSRVRGGKSHELVVEVLGLGAGFGEEARDGVPGGAGEAAGGADAAPLAEVLEDGDGLVGGQLGARKGGALALGVGALAGAAVDHADAPVAAAEAAEIKVASAAPGVVGAGGIVAEEVLDAQAGWSAHAASPWLLDSLGYHSLKAILFSLFARLGHHRNLPPRHKVTPDEGARIRCALRSSTSAPP